MNTHTKIFIAVLVPAAVALGHDAFLFYMNQDNPIYQDGDFTKFFASFGFIWTTYHPESYQEIVRSVSPETWSMINMVLTQKAFFVGLGIAGLTVLVMGVLWLFGVGRTDPYPESGLSARGQKMLKKHEIEKFNKRNKK